MIQPSLPDLTGPVPWLHADRFPDRSAEFTFGVISDRTGDARPGVFERGIAALNLLRPDFVVHVGDAIEGATTDVQELDRQWAEFDTMTAELEVPFFRVPGNHDVTNEIMRADWLQRHGPLHYHFLYGDVLFVVLDTSDPPQIPSDYLPDIPRETTWDEHLAELRALQVSDPAAAAAWVAGVDWEGTMPAKVSEEQIAWAEEVIAQHPDVRWTMLCMHMPMWQGEGHAAIDRLRRALGRRPYTAFAGHVHNYRFAQFDGRDHIRLGPTGGTWVIPGDEGNFDHVTLVTMTASGPRIANIALDGIYGADGAPLAVPERATLNR